MSVLIIDPDPGSEVTVRRFFSEQGFQYLKIVATGEDALQVLKENEHAQGNECIHLIIIAGGLPDSSRFKLCRKIRESQIGMNAYILLVVSSIENKTDIIKARKAGATDFAVKPYNSPAFLKQLLGFCVQKTVLLVEDDPVMRQLLSTLLHKKNVELIVMDDGTQAYNLINAMLPVKLVIMDIGLPGMNGLKLVEHIRSKKIWQKSPVLMLTASTDINDVKRSLLSGANDYIAKPFKVPEFMQRIQKYFPEASR